jgi:hypothetical protein
MTTRIMTTYAQLAACCLMLQNNKQRLFSREDRDAAASKSKIQNTEVQNLSLVSLW